MPGGFTSYKAVEKGLPPAGGKENKIIFSRDMCVRENTSQAASVEFLRMA